MAARSRPLAEGCISPEGSQQAPPLGCGPATLFNPKQFALQRVPFAAAPRGGRQTSRRTARCRPAAVGERFRRTSSRKRVHAYGAAGRSRPLVERSRKGSAGRSFAPRRPAARIRSCVPSQAAPRVSPPRTCSLRASQAAAPSKVRNSLDLAAAVAPPPFLIFHSPYPPPRAPTPEKTLSLFP